MFVYYDLTSMLKDLYKNGWDPYCQWETVLLMLYGPTGAGKSSFINSAETALRQIITCQALPDSILCLSKKAAKHCVQC